MITVVTEDGRQLWPRKESNVKVMRLAMRHIKGVRQLDIMANPTCNEIAGANGAGKSSVLDAIVWAFAGKRAIDSKPLRDGCERGEIVVETEELEVRRRFSENGDTKLTVTAKDGHKLGQRELDGLFGRFSFDPLAFSRMDAAEQLTTLQGLAGEEFVGKLAGLDRALQEALEERTLANREVARIGAIPEVERADEVDLGTLTAELEQARAHNDEQRRRQAALDRSTDAEVAAHGHTEVAARRIRELAAALEEARQEHVRRLDAEARCIDATQALPVPVALVDEAPFQKRLAEAGAQNQRYTAYREYLRRSEEKAAKARAATEAEANVEKLRAAREELRRKAQLPVEGVEFGEAGLRVNGIPFDQLSSSERIRISARIGMSMAPALRVMFIKDGSLLDGASFDEVKRLAEERDYQLWVETVGQGHGDAVVLEAGEVASAPLSAVASF